MPDNQIPQLAPTSVSDPGRPLTRAEAFAIWQTHRPNRAWIEWGWCWPPISIARPRCTACAVAWPCPPILAAHDHLD